MNEYCPGGSNAIDLHTSTVQRFHHDGLCFTAVHVRNRSASSETCAHQEQAGYHPHIDEPGSQKQRLPNRHKLSRIQEVQDRLEVYRALRTIEYSGCTLHNAADAELHWFLVIVCWTL